jgi:hypothetical protein
MKADGPQLFLRCEWDQKFFEYNGGKRRRYCSDACKQAAWRAGTATVSEADGPPDPRSIAMITGSHVCTDDVIRSWPIDGRCPECGRAPL